MKKNYWHESIAKLLINLIKDYWGYYLGALLCLVGTHYCQSQIPFLAKSLAEEIPKGVEGIALRPYFLIAIGIFIFRTSSRLLFFTPARFWEKNLRMQIIETLETVSPFRYKDRNPGQIFQYMFSDMANLRALIGFAFLQVGNVVIALSILLPKIYKFNERLVIAYLPMFLAVALFSIVTIAHQHYYKKLQDAQGEVQNFIIESFKAKPTIKNFHSEKSFIEHFRKYCKTELNFFYKGGRGPAMAIPMVPLGVGLSFAWGAHIIFEQKLGAPSLVLFSGFVFLLLEPLMFMSWIGAVWTRSQGSWQRLNELRVDLQNEGRLEIEIKKFEEQGKQEVLPYWTNEGIELNIEKGKWNVLVGETGVGKSTLLLYQAQRLINLNKKVSYVAQEPYLYNDSLLKNLILGAKEETQSSELAEDLLKLFGIDELVETNEFFSKTLLELEVGENGKHLSGGQAKRVALIRSLMADTEYLIWDEPFSSVDVVLEKKIISELKEKNFLDGKTIILTSHRLSTVKHSDKIIYIDKSGVLEKGDSEKVLSNNGATRMYFEKQMV